MLSLQSLENSQDASFEDTLLHENIEAELDYWQNLAFSFEMDDGNTNNNPSSRNNHSSHRSSSASQSGNSSSNQESHTPAYTRPGVQDAVLLAQFASAAGMPPNQPQATMTPDPSYAVLLALLQAQNSQHPPPPSHLGSLPHLYAQNANLHSNPPMNMSWPAHFNPHQQQPQYSSSAMPMSTRHPSLPPINTSMSASTSAAASSFGAPPMSAGPSPMLPGSPDPNDPGLTEDKRRRNTAASARFRIKKKQRNLNLERTVSDLTGRADELEREASDLRRENGWLKEIVMLKGSRLAGLDISPQTLPKPAESSNPQFWQSGPSASPSLGASSSSRARQHEEASSESSDSEDEEQAEGGRKASGKGKERQL